MTILIAKHSRNRRCFSKNSIELRTNGTFLSTDYCHPGTHQLPLNKLIIESLSPANNSMRGTRQNFPSSGYPFSPLLISWTRLASKLTNALCVSACLLLIVSLFAYLSSSRWCVWRSRNEMLSVNVIPTLPLPPILTLHIIVAEVRSDWRTTLQGLCLTTLRSFFFVLTTPLPISFPHSPLCSLSLSFLFTQILFPSILWPDLSNDFKNRRAGVEQMLIDLVLKVNPVAPQARPTLWTDSSILI